MIGEVAQLHLARDGGMLQELFKPVVALGIEKALGGATAAPPAERIKSTPPTAVGSSLVAPKINLEAEPYHDILGNLPLNTYKNKAPHTGSIISVKRIVGANAPGEVCHVHINSGPTFR